jgi:ketosteroid isomerase-like protein
MTQIGTARIGIGLISAVVMFGGVAIAQPQPVATNTRAADEAAIRKADEDWARAAQTKQVVAWVAFYADDAVVLPPNDKTANDKESINKAVRDLLTLQDLTIGWQPAKIEVSLSGDLAYARGTYDLAFKDAKGTPVTDRGKYLEVWKKQSDGGWKCIVDTWNSDLPS